MLERPVQVDGDCQARKLLEGGDTLPFDDNRLVQQVFHFELQGQGIDGIPGISEKND